MDAGERAARERLETLFRAVDRLTQSDLARIGFRAAPEDERESLLEAIDEAAERTGRVALVHEARKAAFEAVMGRYASGMFQPTFVGLNWGLSQGTVEDRVAIAEAFADAAAAAVVEDALDPEIAAALALDAAAIIDMASGEASDGSLAQALREPEDRELGPAPGTRLARPLAAVAIVGIFAIAGSVGTIWVAAAGVVAAIRAIARSGARGGD